MSFWGELRRRNVVRVGIAYLVAAWLVLQVVDVVHEPLRLPQWFPTAVILILAIGLPIALILSWAFELTPEGVKKSHKVPVAESITPSTARRLDRIIIVVLALAVIVLVVDNYVLDNSNQTVAPIAPATALGPRPGTDGLQTDVLPNSIAALPFEDLSPSADMAFLARGIHAEIINYLSRLSDLTVINRDSVRVFEEFRPSLQEIADALRVESLLTGDFQFVDGQIRLVVYLVDPRTNTNLWNHTYQEEFANLLEMQADIAEKVANALEAELSEEEHVTVDLRSAASREAYSLFLQAVEEVNSTDVTIPLSFLERAIETDPSFAPPYALRGTLYAGLLVNSVGAPAVTDDERAQMVQRTRDTAELALEYDPEQGTAHDALGRIDTFTWNWNDAKRSFDRAVSFGDLGGVSIWFYAWNDEPELAKEYGDSSLVVNPLDATSYVSTGMAYGYAGEPERAIEYLERAIELDPTEFIGRSWLPFMRAAVQDRAGALDDLQFLEGILGANRPLVLLPEIAYSYSRIGEFEEAERVAAEVFDASREVDVGTGALAMAYLAIGDEDAALEWLEMAAEKIANHEFDSGFYNLMMIKTNALADSVLERPEFVEARSRLAGD